MHDAYREYLRLGAKRSYDALHERLCEVWGDNDTPKLSTLQTWGRRHGWQARAIADDELINKRAIEHLRDRMAHEAEERRERRLKLSDIQLQAAAKAMVEDEIQLDENGNERRTGKLVPADLRAMHPQTLRAINDTVRVAGETQRLDSGQPTARLGGTVIDMADPEDQIRVVEGAALDEIARFVGLTGPGVIPQDDDDDDADGVKALPDNAADALEEIA